MHRGIMLAEKTWSGIARRACLAFPLGVSAIAAAAEPVTITYVANAENLTVPLVRYLRREWRADQGGYLEGVGQGQRLLVNAPPRQGDFALEFSLALPRAGKESLVLMDDGEMAIASGVERWRLSGRFFRTGGRVVEIPVPRLEPGKIFTLGFNRRGEELSVTVDDRVVHQRACRNIGLGQLGLDPGEGAVRLNSFHGRGNLSTEGDVRSFDNPFGMQLRPRPTAARDVHAPAIVREAPSNECSIVARSDGALEIFYITKPQSDSVSYIRSEDGGLTWSDGRAAFPLPGKGYYGIQALEARDGTLHVVAHVFGQGPGGYRGRLYEVYYARKPVGSGWTTAEKIVPGYIGSIRGFIETRRSRLLLGVARAIPEREQKPASGPDFGWNDAFVYYSDDRGRTWTQSPDVLTLELKTENTTRYGAVEPVMLELNDERIWMLVRDRQGRLQQSFSADGSRWTELERSGFISSDSPAELKRLRDGRIVLFANACQFWTNPRSYAMGGREVLHAAISRDEGKSWRGFREVLHETNRATGGDRGTAYPSAAESPDGKIVLVSGQGESKHAIVLFDPDWLEETVARDRDEAGPVGWTQYGDDGLKVTGASGQGPMIAIPLKSSGVCGGSWNFPNGRAGEITFRVRAPRSVSDLRVCLNDHFTRIDDFRAAEHAVYAAPLPPALTGHEADSWRTIRLRWRDADKWGSLELDIDGKRTSLLRSQRRAEWGVHTLRIEFRAAEDKGELQLADLQATVTP